MAGNGRRPYLGRRRTDSPHRPRNGEPDTDAGYHFIIKGRRVMGHPYYVVETFRGAANGWQSAYGLPLIEVRLNSGLVAPSILATQAEPPDP